VQETKLKAESSKRSEGVSYLDQTGCFLAGGRAHMKLQKDKGMWNGFGFYSYLDRINQSSLKLRPGTQDYQGFFCLRRGAFRPKAALS